MRRHFEKSATGPQNRSLSLLQRYALLRQRLEFRMRVLRLLAGAAVFALAAAPYVAPFSVRVVSRGRTIPDGWTIPTRCRRCITVQRPRMDQRRPVSRALPSHAPALDRVLTLVACVCVQRDL